MISFAVLGVVGFTAVMSTLGLVNSARLQQVRWLSNTYTLKQSPIVYWATMALALFVAIVSTWTFIQLMLGKHS